jgi:N-acetylglutamate synthase-like GNAT family acetyltransferase
MIDQPHIRVARVADLDTVGVLLAASYSSLLASRYDHDLLRRALPHITRANQTLLASGTYYVAEVQPGKPVGCGGWTTANPESGEIIDGEAHIRHFATHPDWVRQGVGTSLLSRCFCDAQSLSIRQLHCFSTLNAERFYRASGFRTVREIDVPVEPGLTLPGILMGRELP